MKEIDFDEYIKKTIDDGGNVSTPSDWSRMEQMISDDIVIGDDAFDKALNSKITSYDNDSAVSDWSRFEVALVASEAEMIDAFDTEIKSKINEHKESFKSAHWQKLKQTLEAELALKRRILIHKSMEIATVLVLAFVLFNIDFLYNEVDQNVTSSPIYAVAHSAVDAEQDVDAFDISNDTRIDPAATIPKADLAAANIANLNAPSAEDRPSLIDQDEEEQRNEILSWIDLGTAQINSPNEDIHYSMVESISKVANSVIVDNDDDRKLTGLSPIVSLDIDELVINDDYPMPLVYIDAASNKAIERSLAFSFSGDFNVASRPLDLKFFQQPKTYGALGVSMSSTIQWLKGNWGFETGLGYSEKSFDPNQLERLSILSSKYERDFDQQTFQIVQIPLHLKHYLKQTSQLSYYAGIGTSLNFIAATNYVVNNKLKQGAPRPAQLIEERSTLSKKDFHDGFLEGGTFVKNTFVTMDMELGIERDFGRLTLFGSGGYKHHVFAQKLGPNNEKLNTVSLNLGLRMTI